MTTLVGLDSQGRPGRGSLMELGDGEFGGPIDRDEQVEPARFGAPRGFSLCGYLPLARAY